MKRFPILIAALAIGLMTTACQDDNNPPPAPNTPGTSVTRAELRDEMRRLWSERTFWMRHLIVSTMAGLPDQQAVSDRLRQNNTDLASAFSGFYGEGANQELAQLLEQDQSQAVAVLNMARTPGADLSGMRDGWRESGRRLSNYFSQSSPNLPGSVNGRIENYVDSSFEQIQQRNQQDFAADIRAFDNAHENALRLGDDFTEGIGTQFPAVVGVAQPDQQLQDLRAEQRRVWLEHAIWDHFYNVSAAADLPDVPAVTERLMRNQVDIGNSVDQYYGGAQGDQLTSLLQQHIMEASRVLNAAKAGDQTTLQQATAALYANGDQIAQFFATINPNLRFEDMQAQLRRHVDHIIADGNARLAQDGPGDVRIVNEATMHILMMADTISNATAAQFPDQVNQ